MHSIEHSFKSRAHRNNKVPASLLASLLFLFVFGFTLQLSGLLSLTLTNILVLFFLALFSLKKRVFNGHIQFLTIFFLAISLYIFISGLITGSSLTSIIVYFYYLLAAYLSIEGAKVSVNKGYVTQDKIFKFLPAFLFLQVLVCALQTIFSTQIAQLSIMPVAPLDIASGTFYLTSDASLGFFCLISSIFAFATNQSAKTKYLILLLAATVVLLTNSKASHLMFAVTSLSLVAFDISTKIRAHKKIITTISPFALLAMALLSFENFYWVQDLVHGTLIEAYDKRFAGPGADRLAPIGEMLYGESPFFGHGLLAYYNPIDKIWLYNSGSSLFYTIFIDCGLLATVLIYSFFFYTVIRSEKRKFFGFLYFFVFFSFSFFNFALTDIAAIFSFCVYLNIHKNNPRGKNV